MYTQLILYTCAIVTKELFYMQLVDGDHKGYVHDEAPEKIIKTTPSIAKAKKFWLSQDPKDEYKVKLRCHVGGTDVMTVYDRRNLFFLKDDKSKDDKQYFTIKPVESAVKGNTQVFVFGHDNFWLTYDDKRLFLQIKLTDYKNQKFAFVPVSGNKDAKVISFSDQKAEDEDMQKDEEDIKPTEPMDDFGDSSMHDDSFGTGQSGSDHLGSGLSGSGHLGSGHSGSAHFGSAHSGSGHSGSAHFGSGHSASAHASSGYSEDMRMSIDAGHTCHCSQELIDLKKEYMKRLYEIQKSMSG